MKTRLLFDTHCHLQDARYGEHLEDVLARAREAGVCRMVVCGTEPADWGRVLALAKEHPEIIPCLGLHPWHVARAPEDWLSLLEAYLKDSEAGVGECGLDYAIDSADRAGQVAILRSHFKVAHRLDRPLSLHCRKAFPALADLAREEGVPQRGAVIHAYSGSAEQARELQSLGFSLAFGCSLTQPANHRAPKALAATREDRLMLETDSPDMPPRHRSDWEADRLNEPAVLTWVLEGAATVLGCDPDALAARTCRNAWRVFGGPGPMPQ